MKKYLPLIIIVVIVLLAGGAYVMHSQKSKAPAMQEATSNTNNNGTTFSSIKDALSKSLSLQCTFTDDQNRKTTAYIKAGAIRADVVGNDASQQYNNASVIIKDKKMYAWDTVKKQGMMMDIPDEQAPTGTVAQNGSAQKPGDVMAMLDKYKDDCKPAVISDSQFTPPSDVTFQDLSKMMAPSTAVPSGMNQQDVQKMMQQYKQQAPQGASGY